MHRSFSHSTLLIIGILFFIISGGCKPFEKKMLEVHQIDNRKVLVYDIDKINETRVIKLSELVESIEIIRLDNKKYAFLAVTWLQEVSGNYLFFADIQNNLMVFDKTGNFISKWEPGRGPSEFILPEHPQIYNNMVFVSDNIRKKLLNYEMNGKYIKTLDLIKSTGANFVLKDSMILSVGNSESDEDPYLICIQDFKANIVKAITSKNHVNITPALAQEKIIVYPFDMGLNMHFPSNDTLMHYNPEFNHLSPKAIFYSKTHLEKNKILYEKRLQHGLEITDKQWVQTVKVVPEFETDKYYFLSIYKYGEKKDLPWYFASRKMCLINKKTNSAFFITVVNDFLGDIPFEFQSANQIWGKFIIQDFSAIKIKNIFSKIILEKGIEIDLSVKKRLQDCVAGLNDDDNNIVLLYELKK